MRKFTDIEKLIRTEIIYCVTSPEHSCIPVLKYLSFTLEQVLFLCLDLDYV